MREKILIIVLILQLFSIVLNFRAHAYDNHDFQVWNTDVEEFKINKDCKTVLEEEFRWGDNANQFYYHHYDMGFFYNLNKYLNLGGGYRHIYELKSGNFKLENEPYVAVVLLWDSAGFKFEDRNRMEYRHFDYQADSWRYRNKLTVKFPWSFTRLEIQPYIADEILVGFGSANQFNQNRFYSGLGMNLNKNAKAEIYYMLLSTRSFGNWTDANVLGTKLKISF